MTTLIAELTSKITVSHLERDAYVYVRQSTLTQVRQHPESLERVPHKLCTGMLHRWLLDAPRLGPGHFRRELRSADSDTRPGR